MIARRGPLASSYAGAVALVTCCLVPFLLLTGAVFPLLPLLSKDLGLSESVLTIAIGLSDGPSSLVPLTAGVVMLAALLVHQYRARHPLMPVRQLATTFPVYGILIAMTASASAVGLMELVLTALQQKSTPAAIALQFLPEFGAAVVTAVLFALLFRTRFTPVLAVTGLAMVAAAGGVLATLAVFILGAERLQAPDLESWTQGEPAWESTPLFSRLRGKKDGNQA